MILVWVNWRNRLMRVRREAGSRLALGSSSTRMSGLMERTVAMETARFSPPERWWVILSARASAWTSRRACSTRRRISSGGSPMLSGPKATSSRTVGMNSWSSACWKTIPTLSRTRATVLGVTGMSPTRTWPEEGGSRPLRWSSSVDFPAPFPPTTATDSPWVMRRETPFSAGGESG